VLQEIRALSTKMDESATRISALAQQVNELRVQYKALEQQESAAARQSPDDLYNQAMRDFVQENFDLSIQGFSDYANNYPGGEKAASALYYIGEIYRRQKQLTQAAAAFTRVINEYPGTGSVAGALFKRALTALDLQDKDKAIIDFKAVVEKYPDTSEAAQAKTELQRIDVKPAPKPAKKAPARRTR
jgi:tol-pal system protein YbgF